MIDLAAVGQIMLAASGLSFLIVFPLAVRDNPQRRRRKKVDRTP